MIKISGTVPHHADRFHVNLQLSNGGHEQVDSALHINPRFPEGSVVRNAYLHRSWGTEESQGHLPLHKGAPFECIILSTPVNYRIAFNGAHFCEFTHRVGMEQVNHLNIGGDVIVHSIHITNPSIPQPPPVPHKQFIYGGFVEGRRVIIQGMPKPGADRFSINLCYHQSTDSEIAFHFNPRLHDRVVVMNTLSGRNWGHEDRNKKHFPFTAGVHFTIEIRCEKRKYKIFVNGSEYDDYEHRLKNLPHIQHLDISGDVMLSKVEIP